jgi:hypothetical protein
VSEDRDELELPDERYLWDKTGRAEPETLRLEALLGRYAFEPRRRFRFPRRAPLATRVVLALAAAALVAIGVWWFERGARPAGYDVSGLSSLARAETGQSFDTGAGERAVIHVAALGSVVVEPHSRVRVDDAGREVHKLFLERGTVRASIFAAPNEFQVDTPAGLSIDLGCVYDVSVDRNGATHVRVATGQVAFEARGRRVIVPRDHETWATRDAGPTIVVRWEADERFVECAKRLDAAEEPLEADLQLAREHFNRDDSATYWHLFRYARSAATRRAMFALLERLYPRPDEIAREVADAESALTAPEEVLEAWRAVVERDWR